FGDETPADTSTAWKVSVDASLAATQSSYSDNWVGGELGSFNWTFISNSSAEKQLSPKVHTATTLKLSFGQTYSQVRNESGAARWLRPEKSTDLIDLESVLSFPLHRFVDPYAALRVETQFFDGSYRPIKRYFSPAKITESFGGQHIFSDTERLKLKSRVGFALRQIVTSVITDTVTEATSRESTNDGGIESVTDLKAALNSKLSYTSKLSLYKAFFFSKEDSSPNDYWKAADVNWEHIVTAQIAKYLQTVLYFQLLYDKEIDKGVRVKQTLGLGLTLKVL
ncbi:MAG TPA: DUF3078 domain-containing protein, partial [candidate division Zixibacteria bacterium]|nr:DUF3078 domain-containing protein [candidate division Zixibacteria bacterium]